MIAKPINLELMALPGDILLGLLSMDSVAHPVRAMAIINSMNDNGPSEIFVLSNHVKTNHIFTHGIKSFISVLDDHYSDNRFFVFRTKPRNILFNSVPAMTDSPLMDDLYISFWGPEISLGVKKNALPITLLDRTHREAVGEFQAIDIIKENGMDDMLLRIRRGHRQ